MVLYNKLAVLGTLWCLDIAFVAWLVIGPLGTVHSGFFEFVQTYHRTHQTHLTLWGRIAVVVVEEHFSPKAIKCVDQLQ